MDWDAMMNQDWDADQKFYDNRREQEMANQAMVGIIQDMMSRSGNEPLDMNDPEFGQKAAMAQKNMGTYGLEGLAGNENLKHLDTNRVGSLASTFLKMQQAPDDFRMKEFERRQTRQQGIEQASAAKIAEQQARKTKALEIDMAEKSGQLTPEQAQQARMVLFGLQPQARQAPTQLEIFKQVQNMPPEERAAYYRHLQETNPKAFQINTGGGDKASNYQIMQDDQGNLVRINKLTNQVEPTGIKGKGKSNEATVGEVMRVKTDDRRALDNPNNYDLTDDEFATAIKTKMIPPGARLKPEILDEINQNHAMVGLPPLQQEQKTYNTKYEIPGDKYIPDVAKYHPVYQGANWFLNKLGGQTTEYGGIKPVQQGQQPAAPAPAPIQPPQQTAQPQGYKSADDVKAAFQSGKISREKAKQILQRNFGMK